VQCLWRARCVLTCLTDCRWTGHTFTLLDSCTILLTELTEQHVEEVFGRFPAAVGRIRSGGACSSSIVMQTCEAEAGTLPAGDCRRITQQLNQRLLERTDELLKLFLDMESQVAFTLNSHYFEGGPFAVTMRAVQLLVCQCVNRCIRTHTVVCVFVHRCEVKSSGSAEEAVLRQLRRPTRSSGAPQLEGMLQVQQMPATEREAPMLVISSVLQVLALLAQMKFTGLTPESLYGLKKDPNDPVLDMIATCLSYFKVSIWWPGRWTTGQQWAGTSYYFTGSALEHPLPHATVGGQQALCRLHGHGRATLLHPGLLPRAGSTAGAGGSGSVGHRQGSQHDPSGVGTSWAGHWSCPHPAAACVTGSATCWSAGHAGWQRRRGAG
jgi:hypothetical protein